MTYNEIIPNLFLGSQQDAIEFDKAWGEDGTIICVLEQRPANEPFRSYHIPVRTSSGHVHEEQLTHISWFLRMLLSDKRKTLIHCAAGLERSPLAVSFFLVEIGFRNDIKQAYEYIKTKRPEIYDRSDWLV